MTFKRSLSAALAAQLLLSGAVLLVSGRVCAQTVSAVATTPPQSAWPPFVDGLDRVATTSTSSLVSTVAHHD